MNALRFAGALLFVGCGWCAGSAVQARLTAHENALRATAELLQRIRQEVAYRRADFDSLCRQLASEGLVPPGSRLQELAPPPALSKEEHACFQECVSGLGRASAQQECERLDYYIQRFEVFLQVARQQTQSKAVLSRKLGLAAGIVLALLFL